MSDPGVDQDYEPVDDVVYIPLEDLVVDPQNIRGGAWDGDPELIKSIERTGIHQPLVVRPFEEDDDGEIVWGIVAGSRRYNAAIDAGLDQAPCRIMDLDDTEAMLYSMEENRNRRPTARWRDIEFVGEIAERLNGGATKSEIYGAIQESVGMSYPTIQRYHRIYKLPEKTKALLREPEDLTQGQRDYLRSTPDYTPSKLPLTLKTLEVVWNHLRDWDERDQVAAALQLDDFDSDVRGDLAEDWADNPDASLDDLVAGPVKRGKETRSIQFDREILEALGDAAMDRQTPATKLIDLIVKRWLKNEGYLK